MYITGMVICIALCLVIDYRSKIIKLNIKTFRLAPEFIKDAINSHNTKVLLSK